MSYNKVEPSNPIDDDVENNNKSLEVSKVDAVDAQINNENNLKSPNEETASRSQIIMGIIMYSLCSASLLLINKIAVTQLKSVSPVLIAQFISSVVFVKILDMIGYLKVDALEWGKVKSFWGVSFLFSLCLFTNVKALQYANVETVIVFRSCSPIAVSLADYFFLKRALPNVRSFLSLLVIVVGSVAYVLFDKEFELDSYVWVFAYFISIVSEMVYVKYIINEIDMSTWGRVYYNNLLSIPPVLVLGYIFNDHEAVLNTEFDAATITAVILSCIVGVGISYAGFNLRALISATSFTVVGVVNKLATTAVNAMIWDKHANIYGIISLFVCIFGGTLYQQSGKRK